MLRYGVAFFLSCCGQLGDLGWHKKTGFGTWSQFSDIRHESLGCNVASIGDRTQVQYGFECLPHICWHGFRPGVNALDVHSVVHSHQSGQKAILGCGLWFGIAKRLQIRKNPDRPWRPPHVLVYHAVRTMKSSYSSNRSRTAGILKHRNHVR